MRYKRPLFFIAIFGIFFLWSLTSLDPDFGWHLRSGMYFLEHGIPQTDVFTYTASQFPWVNHEWLSDILVSLIYNLGSYWLLALVYAALWTVSVVLVSRRVPLSLVFVAVLGLLPFSGIRALTWSVFFLAILITILRTKNTNWRLTIPALILIWANFHGSFLLGFLYGGWVMIKEKSWKLLIIGSIALLLTFCNPYGYHIYTEIFRTMLDGSLANTIEEWRRFAFPLSSGVYTLVWLGLIVFVVGKNWKGYVRLDTLLFIWSAMSMRMLPIFTIVSLSMLPEALKKIESSITLEARPRFEKVTYVASIAVVIIASISVLGGSFASSGTRSSYPVHAVAYLSKKPCQGNLFNEYNHGGYLIAQLPDHKVYIDGRMPSWEYEGRNYIATYKKVSKGESVWKDEFSEFSITCAIVYANSGLNKELKASGWKVVTEDMTSQLLFHP